MKKLISLVIALVMCTSLFSVSAESAIDTIMSVGTCQAFSDEAVSDADIETIAAAGLAAASAINQQPWYFVVVTNSDVMAELAGGSSFSMGGAGAAAPAAGEGAGADFGASSGESAGAGSYFGASSGESAGAMPAAPAASAGGAKASLGDSPVAIIIYKNDNTSSPDASFDCGMAVQNMIIAANALGYSTKVVSSPTMTLNGANHDSICAKLGVDASYKALAVLLIGHADLDATTSASVRQSVSEKVSFVK